MTLLLKTEGKMMRPFFRFKDYYFINEILIKPLTVVSEFVLLNIIPCYSTPEKNSYNFSTKLQ